MDVDDNISIEIEIMSPSKTLNFTRGRSTTIAGLKDELKSKLSYEVPDLETNKIVILHENERPEDSTLLGTVSGNYDSSFINLFSWKEAQFSKWPLFVSA